MIFFTNMFVMSILLLASFLPWYFGGRRLGSPWFKAGLPRWVLGIPGATSGAFALFGSEASKLLGRHVLPWLLLGGLIILALSFLRRRPPRK